MKHKTTETSATELDPGLCMPYGDTINDGKVQLSFTLPLEAGDRAREAARVYAEKMGLKEPAVVYMKDLGEGFSFFIIYGSCSYRIDLSEIEIKKVDTPVLSMKEIDAFIKKNIERKLVFIGASTGTDAHTVGIDAIFNMKGYAGHYGLERYSMIEAHNLGSQVTNEELINRSRELKADAILISQTVTQKNVHIHNLSQLIKLIQAEGLRERFIVCCGGPRITHELALELGFDAGFGEGCFAEDVASFVIQYITSNKKREET